MNMFNDKAVTLSYYRCLAAGFGTLGVLMAITGAVFHLLGHGRLGDAATILTVPLVGATAVLRVRAFFATLHNRWMAAFEAGRIVGQEQEREAAVTRLR